jgi:hypothetical protein
VIPRRSSVPSRDHQRLKNPMRQKAKGWNPSLAGVEPKSFRSGPHSSACAGHRPIYRPVYLGIETFHSTGIETVRFWKPAFSPQLEEDWVNSRCCSARRGPPPSGLPASVPGWSGAILCLSLDHVGMARHMGDGVGPRRAADLAESSSSPIPSTGWSNHCPETFGAVSRFRIVLAPQLAGR